MASLQTTDSASRGAQSFHQITIFDFWSWPSSVEIMRMEQSIRWPLQYLREFPQLLRTVQQVAVAEQPVWCMWCNSRRSAEEILTAVNGRYSGVEGAARAITAAAGRLGVVLSEHEVVMNRYSIPRSDGDFPPIIPFGVASPFPHVLRERSLARTPRPVLQAVIPATPYPDDPPDWLDRDRATTWLPVA
jgi:hypothetical protein